MVSLHRMCKSDKTQCIITQTGDMTSSQIKYIETLIVHLTDLCFIATVPYM